MGGHIAADYVRRMNDKALAEAVGAFMRDGDALNAKEAEERLLPILTAVMSRQGFDLEPEIRPRCTDHTRW